MTRQPHRHAIHRRAHLRCHSGLLVQPSGLRRAGARSRATVSTQFRKLQDREPSGLGVVRLDASQELCFGLSITVVVNQHNLIVEV